MASQLKCSFGPHVAANRSPDSYRDLAGSHNRSRREQKEFFMLSKVCQFSRFHVGGLTARTAMALAALAAVGAAGTAMATTTYTYTPVANTAPGDSWSAGTDWSATPVSNAATTLTFVGTNSTVLANGLNNTNTDNFSGAFIATQLDLNGTGPASGAGVINIAASSGSYLNLVQSSIAGAPGGLATIALNANAGAAGLTYNVSAPITLVGNGSYGNRANIVGTGTATFNFTGGITAVTTSPANGPAQITMSDTATINLSGATSNIGILDVSGTINDSANLNVGNLTSAYGSSFVQSGGTVTEGTPTAGATVDGSNIRGSYTLNSGTFNAYIGSGNALTLGYRGTPMANLVINGGTLTVETGTNLTSQLNVSNNGTNGTSNATVTQNAGTVTVGTIIINSGSNSTPADQGAGLYELNGGTLITSLVIGQYNSGNYGTSTFDFNGGTLQASAANTGFIQTLTAANVQAGGAIINTNGFSDTITSNLISDPSVVGGTDGGLTKQGLGTLTLSGTGNTYNGNTTVSGGTLQIDTGFLAATSTVSIASAATMNLDFTGTDTIASLILGGLSMGPGTYSHANESAYFGNFAGVLNVTGSNIPEPATLGLMALGGLGILASGRRRRA